MKWLNFVALLCAASVAQAGTYINGSVVGGFETAECAGTSCPGWTAVSSGVWQYGDSRQPGYVMLATYPGGLSGTSVSGPAVTIAQLHFQNAQYWGLLGTAQDDPTAAYSGGLFVDFVIDGQNLNFNWDLGLSAVNNSVDTLSGLPAAVSSQRFTLDGQDYMLNLLGFFQGSTRVTELTSSQWQFVSADLRVSVTPAPPAPASPVPEPSTLILIAAGVAMIVAGRARPGKRSGER